VTHVQSWLGFVHVYTAPIVNWLWGITLCLPALSSTLALSPTARADDRTGRLVLVVGAAGTEDYSAEFREAAEQWRKMSDARGLQRIEIGTAPYAANSGASLQTNSANVPSTFAAPGGTDAATSAVGSADSAGDSAGDSVADRERLRAALEQAALELDAQDDLWLVLIGHGTSERGSTKFNLIGPDFSHKELAQWLQPLTARAIIVNCSSASAPFLPELSRPGRVVITATRSGTENNYSRFGKYLALVLQDLRADLDHDDELSLLEAFLAASAETERFYREQSRLASEHALLDDNGDKLGTGAEFYKGTRPAKSAPAGKSLDGDVARRIIVHSAEDAARLNADQMAERDRLERELDLLRGRKDQLAAEAYWNALEQLLVQLSQLYQSARN
jgi:hypothetical protein